MLLFSFAERDMGFWGLVTLVLISGCVSSMGSLASTLAVEKDWVKTICTSPEVSATSSLPCSTLHVDIGVLPLV